MLPDKYRGARLKIDRAKQHIFNLQRMARNVPRLDYTTFIESHPETGHHLAKVKRNKTGAIFSLVIGDAIQNIRSALDHCYAAATGADINTRGQTFFPIRPDRNVLKGFLKKRLEEKAITQQVHDLILNDIRPYDVGHPSLITLHKLANTDKHRLLLTIVDVVTVKVTWARADERVTGMFTASHGDNFELITGPGPIEFEGEPQPTLDIRFGERGETFYNKSAVPSLLSLADDVTVIIRKIEGIVP